MNIIKDSRELELWLKSVDKFYFYGAGEVCKKILQLVDHKGINYKLRKIFVSNLDKEYSVHGFPVKEFSQDDYEKDTPILITTPRFSDEIMTILEQEGVESIIVLDKKIEQDLGRRLKQLKTKESDEIVRMSREAIRQKFLNKNSFVDVNDVLLISPPYWDVYSPFSAVPCLTAYLKGHGLKVKQVDMGIYCIHNLLERKSKDVMSYLRSSNYYHERVCKYEGNTYVTYEEYRDSLWFLEGDSFDVNRVKKEYKEMSMVHKCIVDDFYRRVYDMDCYSIDFETCDDIVQEVNISRQDCFWETLSSSPMIDIVENIPKVVGISITSTCQFVQGCLLAKVIKEYSPETKVIFGGSCADVFVRSEYRNKRDILEFFDYILVGEGETALLQLVKAILENKEVEGDIPNMAHIMEDNRVVFSKSMLEDVRTLPVPDYTGLDLDLYLAPEIILPYQTSRGCHYGQCAFCNHDEKYRHNYRSKDMKKVVDDLLHLMKEYNVKHFQFVDEAIRPDCFREMINEMDKHPEFKDTKWIFYSRVSRLYDEELLTKAKNNGCEMVMFGVESFNARLLKLIRKGISPETSKYCLEIFHKCGIKTYAWLMCNLPSETIEEARCDLQEVMNMKEYIDAFSVGAFFLDKNTDMYLEPEKYNITAIDESNSYMFQSHLDGKIINKEEILSFTQAEYIGYQEKCFFRGNRYTLFFE